MKIMKLMPLLFLFNIALPIEVYANSTDELVYLNEKQTELKEKLNRLNEIGKNHGKYVLIRDTYYYGDDGIIKLSNDWTKKTSKWIIDWKVLLEIMKQSDDLSDLNLQNKIKTEVYRLSKEFESICKLGDKIKSKEQSATMILNEIGNIPLFWVENYQEHIAVLNKQIAILKNSLAVSKKIFQNSTDWKNVLTLTDESVTTVLKKTLLRYPELATAIARIDELFQSERIIKPEVYKLMVVFENTLAHLRAKRIFAADKSLIEFNALLEKTRAFIQKTEIDAEFTADAMREIEQMDTELNKLRQNLNAFTKAQLVQTNFITQGRVFVGKCRDSEIRKSYNCELFKHVYSIPAQKILTLNDVELETIELQIEKIKQNPLGVQK